MADGTAEAGEVQQLPPPVVFRGVELPRSASVLVSPDGVEVVLLGTAHISKASVDEAQLLVNSLHPDAVFLEVCDKRRGILSMNSTQLIPDGGFSVERAKQILRSGGGTAGLMGLCIATMTASLSKKVSLDTFPGAEFAMAAQEASKLGILIVLGDRDLNVTLKRMWAPLTWWERIRFVWALIRASGEDFDVEDLEKLKNSDFLTHAIKELGEEFPGVLEPLLYERDRVLNHNLRHTCRLLTNRRLRSRSNLSATAATISTNNGRRNNNNNSNNSNSNGGGSSNNRNDVSATANGDDNSSSGNSNGNGNGTNNGNVSSNSAVSSNNNNNNSSSSSSSSTNDSDGGNADALSSTSNQQHRRGPPLVVAVVGMGHVAGIKEIFQNDLDEEDFRRINSPPVLPTPRTWAQTATRAAIPLAALAAAYAVYRRYRS